MSTDQKNPEYLRYCSLFFLSLAINVTLIWLINPQPNIYDEFSYLIGADLFSQGKICAEQHPFWKHFETYMISSQPAYCSKYLPLQSLILAIGQIFFNQPIIGVAIIFALTVSLSYWTFQAYFNQCWSLLGSLLLALHPTLINNISLNYMGSAGSLLAGFLICGSLGRLIQTPSFGLSIIFSLGSILTLLNRPYEGLLLVLISISTLVYHYRSQKNIKILLQSFFIPLIVSGLFLLLILLTFNYYSTGSPWKSAYLIYEQTYGFMRPFIFSPPPPSISFNHTIMEDLHIGRNEYFASHIDSFADFYMFEADKFKKVYFHYLPLIGSILLFFTYSLLQNSKFKLLLLISTLFYISALFPVWATHAHYSNPIAAINLTIILFLLQSAYQRCRINNKTWLFYIFLCLSFSELIYHAYQQRSSRTNSIINTWNEINKITNKVPGQHLILVKYPDNRHSSEDFIYNFAPIDQQSTIFARSLGVENDQKLLDYYPNRHKWSYQCDAIGCKLESLSPEHSN